MINVLVNNAGVLFLTDYEEITVEKWDSVITVSFNYS
jgi:NADP-dependent 3-hydroxy acid dehydrogenase YdfG